MVMDLALIQAQIHIHNCQLRKCGGGGGGGLIYLQLQAQVSGGYICSHNTCCSWHLARIKGASRTGSVWQLAIGNWQLATGINILISLGLDMIDNCVTLIYVAVRSRGQTDRGRETASKSRRLSMQQLQQREWCNAQLLQQPVATLTLTCLLVERHLRFPTAFPSAFPTGFPQRIAVASVESCRHTPLT